MKKLLVLLLLSCCLTTACNNNKETATEETTVTADVNYEGVNLKLPNDSITVTITSDDFECAMCYYNTDNYIKANYEDRVLECWVFPGTEEAYSVVDGERYYKLDYASTEDMYFDFDIEDIVIAKQTEASLVDDELVKVTGNLTIKNATGEGYVCFDKNSKEIVEASVAMPYGSLFEFELGGWKELPDADWVKVEGPAEALADAAGYDVLLHYDGEILPLVDVISLINKYAERVRFRVTLLDGSIVTEDFMDKLTVNSQYRVNCNLNLYGDVIEMVFTEEDL